MDDDEGAPAGPTSPGQQGPVSPGREGVSSVWLPLAVSRCVPFSSRLR